MDDDEAVLSPSLIFYKELLINCAIKKINPRALTPPKDGVHMKR